MPIDYSATKSKFPGLAAGKPKAQPAAKATDEGEYAEGDNGPKAALSEAESALTSALAAVRKAKAAC